MVWFVYDFGVWLFLELEIRIHVVGSEGEGWWLLEVKRVVVFGGKKDGGCRFL